jgi:uncharacterized membrane protein YozB (DUF420 family)
LWILRKTASSAAQKWFGKTPIYRVVITKVLAISKIGLSAIIVWLSIAVLLTAWGADMANTLIAGSLR